MSSFLPGFLSTLAGQLPALLVCLAGIYLAMERHSQQPQRANRALWGFGLLLFSEIVSSGVNNWLIAAMNAPDADVSQLQSWLSLFAFGTRLLIALALALLLRAIFPALPGSIGPSWRRYLLGILLGLALGIGLGMLLGDPIGSALGISTFEGGRGYFVIFVVIPAAAILGGMLGALATRLIGTKAA